MDSPAFGQADLTNCERELIHLTGSVQPHGLLLALADGGLQVLQASENVAAQLGRPATQLLERPLAELGGDLATQVAALAAGPLEQPVPLAATTGDGRRFEGALHRAPGGPLVLELEPVDPPAPATPPALNLDGAALMERLGAAVQRLSNCATLGTLADSVVQLLHDLTGYDRVMVYKFDTDGHGKVIAEARDPRLESLLGHHYPATDIPQRARELYLKNRVRLLVDVDYAPQALVPALLPGSGQPLDMSMCGLRSMSPLHLQYLRNMGVTGTLVASLVREGRLWGLVAMHHYSPRHLRWSLRAAVDLLAEVASTRLAAIENYAHAQVALMVRRLEQRLIEATSTEGDWRQALFRNPRTLLQPLEATGAALFHDGEIMTSGEVPSTPELRALRDWIDGQHHEAPFACSAVAKENPALDSLTPTAAGVMAVKLSASRPDYLMWFRKEQLLTLTWAGNPAKPMVNDDPLTLSPRRSFQAWSEIVRGTAVPWSNAERVLARALGAALVDIIVQVHAVRLLIAEHQLAQIRATVGASTEAVLVCDPEGRVMFANDAFVALGDAAPAPGSDAALCFDEPEAVRQVLQTLALQPWRGEWAVRRGAGVVPVSVRAEAVPARDGALLGFIVTLADLSDHRRTAEARRHLEAVLEVTALGQRRADEVMSAILTNASLAAMDIADAAGAPPVAPLLQELEASAQRAAALYAQIRSFSG